MSLFPAHIAPVKFDLTAELPNYINHLNIGWPEMFSTALSEQLLTEAQIRKYSIFSLYYSDDDIIKLINKDNCLCNYISEAYDYLTIDNPNIDILLAASQAFLSCL